MGLEVIFGWYLDGPSFPETVDGSHATAGKLITGPAGLINQLALRSGLLFPLIPQAVRIANYLAALKEVDDGNQHYSRSFKADAWSTASYLLVVRDQLVTSGWNPNIHRDLGPKVDSLCQVEAVAQNISGVADLNRKVFDHVQTYGNSYNISSIELTDQRQQLPMPWRRMLDQLEQAGVQITARETAFQAPANSDLGKVQRLFAQQSHSSDLQLSQDGSVTLLESDDELQAAEAIAAFLSADLDRNRNLVLIRGLNTSILDEACSVQGLPRIGGQVKSRWRAIPQLLSLVIANRWKPVDPLTLLEFLSLPLSPVPRQIGYRFARALRLEPGFGSSHWTEAWSETLKEVSESKESGVSTEHFERELRYWLLPFRFDPGDGIPMAELLNLSGRLRRWSAQHAVTCDTTSEMLKELNQLCQCFEQTIKDTRFDRITRAQMNRILDAVYKDGIAATSSCAEAANWTHVDHPGQIWAPASTVVWWGCIGERTERFHLPWTAKELGVLHQASLHLEHPTAETVRESHAWYRCLSNVKDVFLMAAPKVSLGEPTKHHPFITEILARVAASTKFGIARAEACKIYENATVTIARRDLVRKEKSSISLPPPKRHWQLPPLKPRSEESASSVELLLGCPLAWVLRYKAQMHPGSVLSVPHASDLIGHSLHSCINKLYREKLDWLPESAAQRICEIFDEQIDDIALPLLLPGRIVERKQVRKALRDAVFDFQNLVCKSGFSVSRTELRKSATWSQGQLVGQVDLMLKDQESNQYIVDFKWARSLKYKRDEIKDGRHLQLALYAFLHREMGVATEAGYYMMNQRQLLSACGQSIPESFIETQVSLEELWTSALNSYEKEAQFLLEGNVIAKGVEPPDQDDPLHLIPPPCTFCDFEKVCGKRRYE